MPAWPPGASRSIDDRPQALRRAVDGRGQPRRSGADDHRVVLGRGRLGAKPEQLGQPAKPGPLDGLAVDDADDGNVLRGRNRCRPTGRQHPARLGLSTEADLVAIEEAPQLPAGRVPAVPETTARVVGAPTARPWRPPDPPMRFLESLPISFATSGELPRLRGNRGARSA